MLGQKPRRGQDPLQIGGEKTVGVLVGQDPGGFSQLPERQAQGAGTADGVPIGPAVGEDQHLIQLPPAGGRSGGLSWVASRLFPFDVVEEL